MNDIVNDYNSSGSKDEFNCGFSQSEKNSIYSIDFTRKLPLALKEDETILALANIISGELQKTIHLARQNIVFPRIDELDESVLDIFAYDLHVDWYDYTYPVETKRRIIKDSIKIHKYMGTKYAIQQAIGNVYPNSIVREWFEYGGQPYCFRIIINEDSELTENDLNNIMRAVKGFKNVRSLLENICLSQKYKSNVYVGGIAGVYSKYEVKITEESNISYTGNIFAGMKTSVIQKLFAASTETAVKAVNM